MKNGSLLIFAFLFIFTNSLSAAVKTWDGGAMTTAWEHPNNWSDNTLPTSSDQVVISTNVTVTLSSNRMIIGLQLTSSGKLQINTGITLTTTGDNNSNGDGVRIRSGSSLTVNGTLNISGCSEDGIDIDNTNSTLVIGEDGIIVITGAGDNGIEITGAFTNNGDITITSPTDNGIHISSAQTGSLVNNTGDAITISGAGDYAIANGTSSNTFTNDGIVTLSDAGISLYQGSGDFINSGTGTFNGDGTFSFAEDFIGQAGSTIAPGASPGKLIFDDGGLDLDYNLGINFDIEIDGTTPGTEYDQIVFNGNVDIGAATLDLSGSHVPVSPNVFTLIDVPTGKSITGTINGKAEGGTFMLNGETLFISYIGGVDGNDITLSFDSPLPVELISFGAQAMEREVKLSWTTANEENNDYFTLERSIDGRSFEAIAMVDGSGSTTEISKYIHMDNNPRSGLNYYRLKQTDYDGTFSYSDIETADFGTDETIKVYPTAATDFLKVEIGHDLNNDLTIIIRDLTGREYKSFEITTKSNRKEISLIDLTPGSYFISIYNNDTVETHKFIKL